MNQKPNRRQLLRAVGITAGVALQPTVPAAEPPLRVAGRDVEIQVSAISDQTLRFSVVPFRDSHLEAIPYDGALLVRKWKQPTARIRTAAGVKSAVADYSVEFLPDPLTLRVSSAGTTVQQIGIDRNNGALMFSADSALLGFGEGGPQFDRRGSRDPMRSGQGGYRLHTHGGRVPVPWLIGTAGWAIFVHQPTGLFNLTGSQAVFKPSSLAPLDFFLVVSKEPEIIMREYAGLTGFAEMPPLWSLGYQQSHRTLSSRKEVIGVAKTFREKKLPCDALIYLGTGFCPSGWNTANGSFSFNRKVFSDPEEVIGELHKEHFRVVLHTVILSSELRGAVRDGCAVMRFDEEQASCHWDAHRKVFSSGVDGWWPDEGDALDVASRLTRNRMYWEGPQLDRTNERPYALHRNGYAGMQRYASFLWSGDVYSTWETLRTHVPIAINTGLTGIPYWGTDIGGFVPTKELTGELYVRWFQFGAFNPLFRSHGRTWRLRLPWGWNTGELGPNEVIASGEVANPDPSELHNAGVEPICRKYLELRYRLMPYLYSSVRECCHTGMPVIRALWLHYPSDPKAVERGDEYLWGPDILVAPVTEKGATERMLYLPCGTWYDFWTNAPMEGGAEIRRVVDLETIPLYVRAGAILPFSPLRQYTDEVVEGPLEVHIYPGADGTFTLYEDDGRTFNYRHGEWMGVRMSWDDRARTLAVRLEQGSRLLAPFERKVEFKLASGQARSEVFVGRPLAVRF